MAVRAAGAARRRRPPSRPARRPSAGGDEHGKPARIAEGDPGQIDDDPAGMRPRQASKLFTQYGCGRDAGFAADRRDGVTILTADGKCRAQGHDRFGAAPSPAAHLGSGQDQVVCAQGDADMTAGAQEFPGLAQVTRRRPSCLRRPGLTPWLIVSSATAAAVRACLFRLLTAPRCPGALLPGRGMVLNEAGCRRSPCRATAPAKF